MKKLLYLAAILLSALTSKAESYIFDWSNPASLTPAFPAPTSANRYGEYISNVTFTAGPVTFTVDDTTVKEQSQRARFLYGYLTETVEMRAYPTSILKFEVPEDLVIESITFEGAKVTDEYIAYGGQYGTFSGSAWNAGGDSPTHAVELDILATINCTSTVVKVGQGAGVDNITVTDGENYVQWFTLSGVKLDRAPSATGFYIRKTGSRVEKIAIR